MGDSVLLPQIRNLRNVADYRRKQLRLKNALKTGVNVDNEADTSAKIAAEQIRQNILPIMPNQDLLEASREDKTKQFNTAFDHLKSIMSGNHAQTVLRERFGDLEQLQEFNRHWAGFQKFVSGVSLTQPRYFYQYWDRYLKILQATDNTGQFMPLQRSDVEDFFGGPGGVAGRPSGASGPSSGGPGGPGDGGDDGYGDDGGSFPGTPSSSVYGTPIGSVPGTPQQRFFPPSESAPGTPRRGWYEEYEPGFAPGDPETKYSEPPNAYNESTTPEANFSPSANPGFTTSQRYAAEAGARALERRRQLRRIVEKNYGDRIRLLAKRRGFNSIRNVEEYAEFQPVVAEVVPGDGKKKVDDEKRRQDELKAAEEEQRKKEAAEKKAEAERRRKEAEEAEAERRRKEAAEKKAEAERKKKEEEEVREAFRKAEAQRKKEDEERQRTSKKLQAAEKLSRIGRRIGRKLDKQKGFNAFDKNADYSKGTELAIESFQELQREISGYFLRKKLRYNLYKRPVDYVTGEDIDVQRKYMITKARKIFNGRVFYDTEKNRWVELGKDEDSYKVGLTAQAKKPYLIDGVNQVFNDIQAVEQTDNEERARRAAEEIQEILRKKQAQEEQTKRDIAQEKLAREQRRKQAAAYKITKAARKKLGRKQKAAPTKNRKKIVPIPGDVQDEFEEALNRPEGEDSKKESKAPRSRMTPPRKAPQKRAPNPLTPPPPKKSDKAGEETPMNVDQAEKPQDMDVDARGRYTIEQIARTQPMSDLYNYIGQIYMDDLQNAINSYTEEQREQAVRDAGFTTQSSLNTKAKRLKVIDQLRRNTGEGRPRSPKTRREKRVGKNIRFGAGISAPDEPRYDRFGCYLIHMPSLGKNRLNIKFPSLASHPKIPQRIISSELTALLQKILETGQMNAPLYAALSASDKEFFDNLAHMCRIGGKLGIAPRESNADMQRFQVVRGEILSGNDAPQLIRELKHLTLKLVTEGKIPKRSAHDLLIEISLL